MHGGMTKMAIMLHRKENLIVEFFKIIVAGCILKAGHIQIINP